MTQVCKRTMRNAWRLSSRLMPFLVVSGLALLLVVGCGGHTNPIAGGSASVMSLDPTSLASLVSNVPTPRIQPSSPSLIFPPNGMHYATWLKKAFFVVTATDPDNDRLQYKIELLQEGAVVAVFDQTQNPKGWGTLWDVIRGGGSKADFASGERAYLVTDIPAGTYLWRVYVTDNGGGTWIGPSNNHTFTFYK